MRPVTEYVIKPGKHVSEEAVQALRDDGVVCMRNVFGSDWLEVIEAGIGQALAGSSSDVDVVKRDGDAGSFSFSSGAWQSVEPFRRFIFDSHLADVAWRLLDTSQLALFYDFLLIKQARSETRNLYRAVDFDDPSADYRHARPELPAPPSTTDPNMLLASPLSPGDYRDPSQVVGRSIVCEKFPLVRPSSEVAS